MVPLAVDSFTESLAVLDFFFFVGAVAADEVLSEGASGAGSVWASTLVVCEDEAVLGRSDVTKSPRVIVLRFD